MPIQCNILNSKKSGKSDVLKQKCKTLHDTIGNSVKELENNLPERQSIYINQASCKKWRTFVLSSLFSIFYHCVVLGFTLFFVLT